MASIVMFNDPGRQNSNGNGQGNDAVLQERLLGISRQLSFARRLKEVTEIARKEVRRLTGADGATFILREGEQVHYIDEDAIGPLWKGRRFDIRACISGWAILNRRCAAIEDVFSDPRIPAEDYRRTFVKSLAMVPIRSEDPLGALGAYWAVRRRPLEGELRSLQALADATALALVNVQSLGVPIETGVPACVSPRAGSTPKTARRDS